MCKNNAYSYWFEKKRVIKILFTSCLFVFCILSTTVLAEEEDYLKALEAEAEDSAKIDNSNNSNSKDKPKVEAILNTKEFLQFEALLESNRPTTYRFYRKLKPTDRTVVYSIYKIDHKLKKASKIVLDLYFDQRH